MAENTIWVTPHPSLREQNRVALYEVHPAHPGGEIAIDGADAGPHEVGESPSVLDALASPGGGQPPRLVRVEAPSPAARAALTAEDPNARQQKAAEQAAADAAAQAEREEEERKAAEAAAANTPPATTTPRK